MLVEGQPVELGGRCLAVDLDMSPHEALRQIGHGGLGPGWRGHSFLATLDAVDYGRRLLARLLGCYRSMLADGNAPGSARPPALHDVGLAPRGGDADAEAGEVAVPVEGILAVGGERVDGVLGDGSVLCSWHSTPRVHPLLPAAVMVSAPQANEKKAARIGAWICQ